MTISKENKEFINSLIEYYVSESESYKQIAENFLPEVEINSRHSIWHNYWMCIFRISTSISKSTTEPQSRGHR